MGFREESRDENSKFCTVKTAAGRHIENRFVAISHRCTVPLTRNLEDRSRITVRHVRHRSCEQNGKFRKFNMADGHQFEYVYKSIYLSRESSDVWLPQGHCFYGRLSSPWSRSGDGHFTCINFRFDYKCEPYEKWTSLGAKQNSCSPSKRH